MTVESQLEELLQWALPKLGGAGEREIRLRPVAGDASGRAYFRTEGVLPSRIIVNAPPATEKNAAFLSIRDILDGAGVRVPVVIDADLERGYLLLEDLGDKLLLQALNETSVNAHYERAFDVLLRMSQVDKQLLASSGQALDSYDRALLSEELSRFSDWFVGGLLDYSPATEEVTIIRNLAEMLISSSLEQPQVLVHRDFHSRNLMLLERDALAVIDFQDAVWGPVTYDLVSLLRDCYVKWPAVAVQAWALKYRSMLLQGTAIEAGDEAQFLRWFDLMGLQRHIKVLGTFARLYLRDGKAGYLGDLPRVLAYVDEILAKYRDQSAAVAEFYRWFQESLTPLIERQGWSTAS